MGFDPANDYPIGEKRPELVATPGGVPLDEVTIDAMREGALAWGDLRATPDTLRLQAEVAAAAGRATLAESLVRAAELATLPAETILEIYTALRPHRSTEAELEGWAVKLEESAAPMSAAFVREAAEVYAKRSLLAG